MTAVPNPVEGGWETVIGLEVHCELKTRTKLFCGCPNAFGSEPNTNVCPVCLGLPGSLPVLNAHAVELAVVIGLALNCEIRPSVFHRKNYFYPDQAKDYQISQYDEPINTGGWLELPDGTRVGVTRAHIEEDTGKTTHTGAGGRIHSAGPSLVDYNRSGVPLVEIVSEPDMRSPDQARAYAAELRSILVASGASDGRMEEGSMRVDANVSVRPVGSDGVVGPLGTRCEIKNLNSLRSLARAVEFEAARQVAVLEAGGVVVQETRHWDEGSARTLTLRSKEEAEDYRYFPEPDLVPLVPSRDLVDRLAAGLGPLPAARRKALWALLGAGGGPAGGTGGQAAGGAGRDQVLAVVDQGLDGLVQAAVAAGVPASLAVARAANEVAADVEAARRLGDQPLVALFLLEAGGRLSATQAKAVLAEMMATGRADPEALAAERGFEAMETDALSGVVAHVVAANPAEWDRFVAGEPKLAQFFVGKVMAATRGKANGKAVLEALEGLRSPG